MPPNRTLFLAGATGAVGQTLLGLSLPPGVSVVPHVRPQSAAKLRHPEQVACELPSPQLEAALRRCTTVVQLIGTMRNRFGRGDTYESSDIGTTRALVDAAKVAGSIDHVVLLSAAGTGRLPGAYYAAKAEAERLVRESGLPFTVVRPSMFADREGLPFAGLLSAVSSLAGPRYRAITLNQLARALLHVAAQRAPLGAVLEGASLWAQVAAAP